MRFILFAASLLASITGSAQTNLNPAATQQAVPNRVAQMPEFPGGYDSLNRFINANMQYPKAEKANHVEGIVGVKFIVNLDGSVSDVSVPRKVSPACDAEAVRIVKLFPKFKPGREGGKVVRVYYSVAVKFILPQ
jgi:periplasmic protein TonB